MLCCDFGRGAVIKLAVEALIVPPPDRFERREFDLLTCAPGTWRRISSVL